MCVLYRVLYPPTLFTDSHELEIILLTSQRDLSHVQEERLKTLLTEPLNWDRLIDLAVDHRVFPLVYWNLNTRVSDLVPPGVLEMLQEHFGKAVSFNLRAKAELVRLLQIFEEQGIPVMPVRGVVVAYTLYDAIWLREFKDIDLLVDNTNFSQAEALLIEQGYQCSAPIEDNAYNQKLYHFMLGIEIELHWKLDSPFMPVVIEENGYWEHTVPLLLDGLEVQTLPLDDLLLMLCFHGAKHRWNRLKWLCDVNEFVRKFASYDWDQILLRAGSLGIRRILLLNLWLVHHLFGTALPSSIVEALRQDRAVEPLGRYLRRWIFAQQEVTLWDQFQGIAFYFFLREKPSDRLFSIRHALQYPKSPLVRSILSLPPVRRLLSIMFAQPLAR